MPGAMTLGDKLMRVEKFIRKNRGNFGFLCGVLDLLALFNIRQQIANSWKDPFSFCINKQSYTLKLMITVPERKGHKRIEKKGKKSDDWWFLTLYVVQQPEGGKEEKVCVI